MGSPVRFPFGVTNVDKTSPFAMMGLPSPLTFHTYFNDFDEYVVTSRWTETKTGAGTVATADVDGGAILITNAAADNDNVFVQKIGESFLLASGKKLFFEARFTVSDATQSDWVMGLQVTDTTPLDVTDGIYFQKDDGDTNIDFYVSKDATTGRLTTTAITTASAAATFMRLSFYFDGKRYVHVWKDGVELAQVDLTTTLATYLPDTELTLSFGIQNGEAVAKTMTIDYVFVAEER
mgnify:CR=1 FL=1|tara:strand:+ start:273 stop:980 length:708 start_codon:yes stop_codon:yes gene_type:complete